MTHASGYRTFDANQVGRYLDPKLVWLSTSDMKSDQSDLISWLENVNALGAARASVLAISPPTARSGS